MSEDEPALQFVKTDRFPVSGRRSCIADCYKENMHQFWAFQNLNELNLNEITCFTHYYRLEHTFCVYDHNVSTMLHPLCQMKRQHQPEIEFIGSWTSFFNLHNPMLPEPKLGQPHPTRLISLPSCSLYSIALIYRFINNKFPLTDHLVTLIASTRPDNVL